MSQHIKHTALFIVVTTILILSTANTSLAQANVTTKTGSLSDGATYLIQVPVNWNGTLFLYSHGYVTPGSPNPATDVGDPATGAFLLANGFALAGSSYATTGWAIHEALSDQIAVLDVFDAMFGHPAATIAWGHSLGGIITAGLIQRNPKRFSAAQPMCGVLSGGVATWNTALDAEFAFKTLLAPTTSLQLVDITNPDANLTLAEEILAAAQATPQGPRASLSAQLSATPLAGSLPLRPNLLPPTSPRKRPISSCGISKSIFRSYSPSAPNSKPAPVATSPGTPALTTACNSQSPWTATKSGRSIKPPDSVWKKISTH